MKIYFRCAAFVACAFAIVAFALTMGASTLPAQAPSAARTPVAVIDINEVFKNHTRFKQMMEDMKQDVKAAETGLRNERNAIAKEIQKLRQFDPGSRDYKRLEEEIATRNSRLKLKMQLQKKEFYEHEAMIYFDVYQDISAAVKYVAQRYGIDLIVRHDSEKMKRNDRASVLKGVNRAVIYHNQKDITNLVVEELQRRNPPTQPGVARRPQIPVRP